MFSALSKEQETHWQYLQELRHTLAFAELSAELGRQRLAQLDRLFEELRANPEFQDASETARSIGLAELKRWQAREWQRVADAQPWLVAVKDLEPLALKVLDWPSPGDSAS